MFMHEIDEFDFLCDHIDVYSTYGIQLVQV